MQGEGEGEGDGGYVGLFGGTLWLLVCLASVLGLTGIILRYLRSKPAHTVSLTDLIFTDLLYSVIACGVACIFVNSFFVFDISPPR